MRWFAFGLRRGRIEEPALLRQYRCAAQRDQSGQSQFFMLRFLIVIENHIPLISGCLLSDKD